MKNENISDEEGKTESSLSEKAHKIRGYRYNIRQASETWKLTSI
jgi:hypothetical protein